MSDQSGGGQGAPAERAGLLPDGHAPAGHELAACDPSRGPAAKDWRTVMRNLISEHDKNVCLHEETHRAGFIWTICDQCGRRWADDRGGFKAYEEPEAVTAAWDILKEADTVAPTPSPATKEEEARSTQDGAEANGWREIASAPKDMTEIIGLDEKTRRIERTWFFAASSQTRNWHRFSDGRKWKPTHWMPIPAPPAPALTNPPSQEDRDVVEPS